MKKTSFPFKLLLAFLPGVIAVLLYILLPRLPWFSEHIMNRFVFQPLSWLIGTVTSRIPLSLAELLLILAAPLLVLVIVWVVGRWNRLPRKQALYLIARRVIAVCMTVLLAYMLMHGDNYYREPLAQKMQLDTSAKSADYLKAICIDLAKKADAERASLPEDSRGVAKSDITVSEMLEQVGDGYRKLEKTYPYLKGSVYAAKPVLLSRPWSYTGISGVYFPMLVEANVNVAMPAHDIPYTAAHELGHTRGFAKEDECNFLAYLACIDHPSAFYRYSGYLSAYIFCSNALYDYSKDMFQNDVAPVVSTAVWRDLGATNDYWQQFEGKIQEVSNSINDSFISSQGVPSGVLSYDEVVSLILAWYQQQDLLGS